MKKKPRTSIAEGRKLLRRARRNVGEAWRLVTQIQLQLARTRKT